MGRQLPSLMRLTTAFLTWSDGQEGLIANTQANQKHQASSDSV